MRTRNPQDTSPENILPYKILNGKISPKDKIKIPMRENPPRKSLRDKIPQDRISPDTFIPSQNPPRQNPPTKSPTTESTDNLSNDIEIFLRFDNFHIAH